LGRILLVLLVFLVVGLIIGAGYFYFFIYPEMDEDKEDPFREQDGFPQGYEPVYPQLSSYEFSDFETIPLATSANAPGYSYGLEWLFLNNSIYEKIGSVIQISVENSGDNALFAFEIGIEPDWSEERYFEATGYQIDPGEKKVLGMVPFEGPETSGNHEYKIGVSIMAKANNDKWYDYDWTAKTSKTLFVLPLEDKPTYELQMNPFFYYDKVLDLMNDDEQASTMAVDLTSYLGVSYNIHKVCYLYDFVTENVNYLCDPDDSDIWSGPDDTLSSMSGDCEDQAFLIASMVKAVGGDVRLHFTTDHAYASFFVGNNQSLDSLSKGIAKYYQIRNNDLRIASYYDEYGNWVILDPTVGFFPGSPALGTSPIDDGKDNQWDFATLDYLLTIDVPKGTEEETQ